MGNEQRRAVLQYLVGLVACLFVGRIKPSGSAVVQGIAAGPVSQPKLVEVRFVRDLKWDEANCILTPIYGSVMLPEDSVLPEWEDKDGNPL